MDHIAMHLADQYFLMADKEAAVDDYKAADHYWQMGARCYNAAYSHAETVALAI